MKPLVITALLLLILIISCENDNPVKTNTEFHKVTITAPYDTIQSDYKVVITFDEKSSSTPPELYYFSGRNLIEIWGTNGQLDMYYNFFYGNFGNIKTFYGPDYHDEEVVYIERSFNYNSRGLLSEISIDNKAICTYQYNSENKISDIRYEPLYDQRQRNYSISFKYGSNG